MWVLFGFLFDFCFLHFQVSFPALSSQSSTSPELPGIRNKAESHCSPLKKGERQKPYLLRAPSVRRSKELHGTAACLGLYSSVVKKNRKWWSFLNRKNLQESFNKPQETKTHGNNHRAHDKSGKADSFDSWPVKGYDAAIKYYGNKTRVLNTKQVAASANKPRARSFSYACMQDGGEMGLASKRPWGFGMGEGVVRDNSLTEQCISPLACMEPSQRSRLLKSFLLYLPSSWSLELPNAPFHPWKWGSNDSIWTVAQPEPTATLQPAWVVEGFITT